MRTSLENNFERIGTLCIILINRLFIICEVEANPRPVLNQSMYAPEREDRAAMFTTMTGWIKFQTGVKKKG
jgi:hypothetical protein